MSQYEAKAYLSLLKEESLTVSEISDVSGIPRTKAYEIVSSLEKKGFLILYPTKPVKYKVVHPKNIFKIFKESYGSEYQRKLQMLENTRKEILKDMESLLVESPFFSKSNDVASVIRGRSNLAKYLTDFLMESTDHVYILATYSRYAFLSETVDDILLKKIKANGVDIRIATPVDRENLRTIKDITKYVEIKHTEEPETGFFTFDGQKGLMITRTNPNLPQYDAGLVMGDPAMVGMLDNLFKSQWNAMETLEERIKNIKR